MLTTSTSSRTDSRARFTSANWCGHAFEYGTTATATSGKYFKDLPTPNHACSRSSAMSAPGRRQISALPERSDLADWRAEANYVAVRVDEDAFVHLPFGVLRRVHLGTGPFPLGCHSVGIVDE